MIATTFYRHTHQPSPPKRIRPPLQRQLQRHPRLHPKPYTQRLDVVPAQHPRTRVHRRKVVEPRRGVEAPAVEERAERGDVQPGYGREVVCEEGLECGWEGGEDGWGGWR